VAVAVAAKFSGLPSPASAGGQLEVADELPDPEKTEAAIERGPPEAADLFRGPNRGEGQPGTLRELLVGDPGPRTEPGTWGPTRGGGQPDTKARLLSVFAGRVLIGPPGAVS
jgi:hypothetical protein